MLYLSGHSRCVTMAGPVRYSTRQHNLMPTNTQPNYPPIGLQRIQLDRTSAVPLYKQLLNEVLSQIASGIWVPGAQLPTEAEFMAAFNISRVTVRQAFTALSEA